MAAFTYHQLLSGEWHPEPARLVVVDDTDNDNDNEDDDENRHGSDSIGYLNSSNGISLDTSFSNGSSTSRSRSCSLSSSHKLNEADQAEDEDVDGDGDVNVDGNRDVAVDLDVDLDVDGQEDRDRREDGAGKTGTLHVAVREARDIKNICIYGNQDVYAKLSFSHAPDMAFSTKPVRGGGRNPIFQQSLQIPVSNLRPDALLRCEIWMMSCARTYLEDQLLGFALVPLAPALTLDDEQRRCTSIMREYPLSSTELFHAPAGKVSLSLHFTQALELPLLPALIGGLEKKNIGNVHCFPSPAASSPDITMLDCSETTPSPSAPDYNKIEFPDLETASERQEIASSYAEIASDDISNSGITPNPNYISRASAAVHAPEAENKPLEIVSGIRSLYTISSKPSLYTSKEGKGDEDMHISSSKGLIKDGSREEAHGNANNSIIEIGSASSLESPLPPPPPSTKIINLEPKDSLIQQQIVDMYMKSMGEFTESLAKMKLPLDSGTGSGKSAEPKAGGGEAAAAVGQKEEGQKLFYGSRAFF